MITGSNIGLAVKDEVSGLIVLDEVSLSPKPPNFGQPDCECRHCQNNRQSGDHKLINHGPHKLIGELKDHELNRVSLPGDVDYAGPVSPLLEAKVG